MQGLPITLKMTPGGHSLPPVLSGPCYLSCLVHHSLSLWFLPTYTCPHPSSRRNHTTFHPKEDSWSFCLCPKPCLVISYSSFWCRLPSSGESSLTVLPLRPPPEPEASPSALTLAGNDILNCYEELTSVLASHMSQHVSSPLHPLHTAHTRCSMNIVWINTYKEKSVLTQQA